MKKLLIVVDYQNDFVNGSLGFDGAEGLDAAISHKIDEYRSIGGDIVFTFDTHGSDYMSTHEGKKLPIEHCICGSDGWRLYGETGGRLCRGDKCFLKGSFGSAALFDYLRGSDYDFVELVGLVSNICVISNAVLAKTALPEAEITVDAACVGSADEKMNQAALDVMSGLQITVINR